MLRLIKKVNERVWESGVIIKVVLKSRSLYIITLSIYLYFFKVHFILHDNKNEWKSGLIFIKKVENNLKRKVIRRSLSAFAWFDCTAKRDETGIRDTFNSKS